MWIFLKSGPCKITWQGIFLLTMKGHFFHALKMCGILCLVCECFDESVNVTILYNWKVKVALSWFDGVFGQCALTQPVCQAKLLSFLADEWNGLFFFFLILCLVHVLEVEWLTYFQVKSPSTLMAVNNILSVWYLWLFCQDKIYLKRMV